MYSGLRPRYLVSVEQMASPAESCCEGGVSPQQEICVSSHPGDSCTSITVLSGIAERLRGHLHFPEVRSQGLPGALQRCCRHPDGDRGLNFGASEDQ
jgi:hypothetical protein